jgi:hypothetical protein
LLISTVFYKYRSFFFELKKVLITSAKTVLFLKYMQKKLGEDSKSAALPRPLSVWAYLLCSWF